MRELSNNERAVLSHVVEDADALWDHANSTEKIDHEKALAEKIDKWQPSYDAAEVKVRTDRKDSESAIFVKAVAENAIPDADDADDAEEDV